MPNYGILQNGKNRVIASLSERVLESVKGLYISIRFFKNFRSLFGHSKFFHFFVILKNQKISLFFRFFSKTFNIPDCILFHEKTVKNIGNPHALVRTSYLFSFWRYIPKKWSKWANLRIWPF